MPTSNPHGGDHRREALGFLASIAFVVLAAGRDVFLGGLLQRASPFLVATAAFSLCTVAFLPVALVRSRDSLAVLRRRLRDLVWINVTSAIAWLAFLAALKLVEPSLVQILYSGIGPLSVVWIDRHVVGIAGTASLKRGERLVHGALLVSLVATAAVALCGLSGTGMQPVGVATLGVVLAAGGGISISLSTVLCRKLSDAGVTPDALLSLRYPATALSAAVFASLSGDGLPRSLSWIDAFIATASLLIVVPSYVNQLAISLASPFTVRVVLATGPVLIFAVQLIEGRLSPSPYSLTAAMLYTAVAISAGLVRQRAIRAAIPAH